MGSSPTPPTPPDPYATASAQGTANAGTATAQTALNNANVINAYGSSMFEQTGSQPIVNPDGSTTSVPTFTNTQTLSPGQQILYNQNTALGIQGNNIAARALTAAGQTLANPLTSSSFAPIQTSLGLQNSYSQGSPLQTGFDQGGAVQTGYDQGPALQYGYDQGPALKYGYDSGGTVVSGYDQGGPIQKSVAYDLASTDAHQNANAPTQFGQTRGQILSSLGNTDFAAERDAATNAVLQRLAPSIAARNEGLASTLANQGVTQNSAAWNAADLQNAARTNDLQLGAVATGDAEQQALFGERLAGGQFQNAAQQQEYGQLLGRGQFAQAGIAQNNAANLNEAQYGLAATGQNNTARLNAGNFANAAQAQQYGENAATAAFSNAAQQQRNTQNANAAGFFNTASDAQNARNAAAAGFFNTTIGQQNAQNAAQAGFYNSAIGQQFGQNQSAAAFGNQATAQQAALNQAQAGFYNDAITRGATFGNEAQQQQYTQGIGLNNQIINQISALRAGGQVSNPSFAGYSAGTLDQTPISSDVYATAGLNQSAYNTAAQLDAANTTAFGNLLGAGLGMFKFSDRRLKRDVQMVCAARNGLPIYLYRYIGAEGWHLGFMADEVEKVRPEAVANDERGFAMVDYERAVA